MPHIYKDMKIKIKFGIIAPLFIACLFLSDRWAYTLVALLAAALHELGHICASKLTGIRLSSLSLDLLGARLTTEQRLSSYKNEIILCVAGPLTNFLCSIAALLLGLFIGNAQVKEFVNFFAASSAALGILNLLPIKSFDGGRILDCALTRFFGIYVASKIISLLSFLCCFSLWSFSVYLMMRSGSSLSLFVFSVSLFSKLFVNG